MITGIKVAQLSLKHRMNKSQRQRIIVFVGHPIVKGTDEDFEDLSPTSPSVYGDAGAGMSMVMHVYLWVDVDVYIHVLSTETYMILCKKM